MTVICSKESDNQKSDTDLYWVSREASVPSGLVYVYLGVQISKGTAQGQQH